MNVADQLAKLAELRDKGILSPTEFEQQKEILLARSGVGATSLGAYDIFELVGEGGMGKVFRGRHRTTAMSTRLGGDLAIKILHPQLAAQPGFAERFHLEAEALAALEHPNVVKIHDVVEDGSQKALVMEWVPGQPLSELIGQVMGPIPWERARSYVDPLLDAVQHAHSRKIIHRDLKPDNIRVTPDGAVKVLDFGIAKMGDDGPRRTKTGTGMGTVAYMAPEQYTHAGQVDERADIYALYEMVAGRLPWPEGVPEFTVLAQKQAGQIPPPTQFYPSIPPWVVDVVMSGHGRGRCARR